MRVHATSINDWAWQMLQRSILPLSFNTPRVRILASDIAGRVGNMEPGWFQSFGRTRDAAVCVLRLGIRLVLPNLLPEH